MTVPITSWDPHILPFCPNVPDPAVKQAVRDAAIRFCEETLVWKEWLDRISVVADDKDYALALPPALSTHADIEKVYEVFYKRDGLADEFFAPLEPTSEDDMQAQYGGAWMFSEAPDPRKFYISPSDPHTLNLHPIPKDASALGLLVRVYCKPLEGATVLPDFLFSRHKTTIKYGALSTLLAAKGMPWYDPKEHLKYEGLYQIERDNLIVAATTGPVRKEMHVRMRNWI